MANVAGKAKRTRTDSVVEPAPEPVEPQIPDLKTTAEHLVYGCPSAQISPTSPANIQLTALQPSRSRHRDKSQVIEQGGEVGNPSDSTPPKVKVKIKVNTGRQDQGQHQAQEQTGYAEAASEAS
jgi:hypothetical protein